MAFDNLTYTTDMKAAAKACDLVSESVPENPDLKRQVFAQLNPLCPAHTILGFYTYPDPEYAQPEFIGKK